MATDNPAFTGLSGDTTTGFVASPQINSKGNPTQRAINNIDQARQVIQTVNQASRRRQTINSRILAKFNAERPYDSTKLENEGLGWRQNFTTKPLPTLIEKVGPRLVGVVDNLKYFTNASLSNKWENSVGKTEKFRSGLTKLIRARRGWKTLLDDICFEDALFGHNIVACLDEFTWFPKSFKQNESACPDGTKSEARLAQITVLKETYLPHELFAQIRDREAAETAGFNIKNTTELINTASPAQLRDQLTQGGTIETWYQNAERELNLGSTYVYGITVIAVYSLLVQEVTGKVSHYRLGGPTLLEVQSKDDRFDSMEDCLAFFTYQRGNGTLHGSKGVGRDIYELAGMIDRTRNEVVDRLIMSGKTLIQGDIKRIHTFRMNVVGTNVIIPNGWTVLTQRIDGEVEPFLKLDMFFGQLANELVGSVSPPRVDVGEGMRSPAAWNLLAMREEEGKDAKISRFLEQFASLVQLMQKRACNSETVEDDAKAFQKEMLENMTREELDELAACPVAGTVSDLTPLQRQMIVALAQEKRGHPLYNQRQLELEDVTARMNPDFAERVLLPDGDPTETAEQNRMQNLEITLLSHGQPVPVSPRDNHVIHMQVLMPVAQQMAQSLSSGQFDTGTLEAVLAHLQEHYTQALNQGVKPETIADVGRLVKQIGPALAQLKQLDSEAAQMQQMGAGLEAEGGGAAPPPM